MRKTDGRRHPLIASWLVVFAGLAGPVIAQPPAASESSALAVELVRLMSSNQLDAVAAEDTEGSDRFVAALAFPGQLLVVSARYEVPLYVNRKIASAEYREVYMDLNAAFIVDTKILVTDSGADGLSADDAVVDMYDGGAGILRLDGDWGAQSMSETDYREAFADADARYARMLRALIAQIR
jgi:hypothetical protein